MSTARARWAFAWPSAPSAARWCLVLMQGGKLAVAGIAIGVAASAAVGQLLGSLLYGVSSYDLLAYGAAAAILMLVALAANVMPAISASRVDPVKALRSE